jgi:ribosome-binding protein aMBF1 (putative translation factor)
MEKSDLLKKAGKQIKKNRESKEMVQVDLTVKMKGCIDTTHISHIEAGKTNQNKPSLRCSNV